MRDFQKASHMRHKKIRAARMMFQSSAGEHRAYRLDSVISKVTADTFTMPARIPPERLVI